MEHFHYQNGQLFAEQVNLDQLADQIGTPTYVYSKRAFVTQYQRLTQAFAELSPTICYSIKSCGNLQILRLLVEQGAGMDVVSGGELYRAQQAGADLSKVVYAGVGKTDREIEQAIQANIGYFNIESQAEFENISAIADRLGMTTRGALRVNPDVADPKTHAKTTTGKKETKFGVDLESAHQFFKQYGHNQACQLRAIHLHIGSPIYSPEPYVRAIEKTLPLIHQLRAEGYTIDALDIGGGFAADYESGKSPSFDAYAQAIVPLLKDQNLQVILEPGRSIAGNAGILLTDVLYMKHGGAKKFAIVDTGMHHLLRPSMYDAFHFIWPTQVDAQHELTEYHDNMTLPNLEAIDIVGPICETGDTLAKQRALPPVERGRRLAIFTAGAYGMVMASNYNTVPRPAEVLVDGAQASVIRARETYDDLLATEHTPQPIF